MKEIALIIMVAVVLEALVEYGKTIMYMFDEHEYKTAITQLITIVLGVGLAFGFHLNLFNKGLSEVYQGLMINSVLDTILTGILFSRGSNYVSDLISKLTGKKLHGIVDEEDEDDLDDEDDEYYEEEIDEDQTQLMSDMGVEEE